MIHFDLLVARAEFCGLAWATRDYVRYVRRHGIDVDRMCSIAGASGLIPVVDCGDGRFDWNAPGDTFDAFVIEALSEDGESAEDFVAWPIADPGHVLTMFGRVPAVGLWEADNPASYYLGKALPLHRTPLDWLKGGCHGAAIVEPRLGGRWLLDLMGPVEARDWEHARELRALVDGLISAINISIAPAAEREARAA